MKNISLTQMSIAEFRAILREELAHLLPSISRKTDKQIPQKEILGVDEVVELLGIKKSAVYHKTHQGKTPHFKKGKKLYFRRTEIEQWLNTGRIQTVDEELARVDQYLQTPKTN